jgi:hypothetical protein
MTDRLLRTTQRYSFTSIVSATRSEVINLVAGSEALSDTNFWGRNQCTVTANATTAPNGTLTADNVIATAANAALVNQAVPFTALAGASYTISLYAKPNTVDWLLFQVGDLVSEGFGANFNVSTGAVGTLTANGNGTVLGTTAVLDNNSFYRVSVTGVFSAITPNLQVQFRAQAADNVSAVNGNALYCWGAQAQIGPVATSYIPTPPA